MVTAEIAAALPALVLVLVAAVWAVALAAAQLRCADAAREAARAAARGEEPAVVTQVAQAVAPNATGVEVDRAAGTVTVEVSAEVSMPGPLTDSVSTTVRAHAVAMVESG